MARKILECKECKEEVFFKTKVCPKCGKKNPAQLTKPYAIGVVAFIAFVVLMGFLPDKETKKQPDNKKSSPENSKTQTEKWYENGTLHKGTAIDWQNATYRNKLATCADYISTWQINKSFNSKISQKISTSKDLKIFATTLVLWIDQAYKPIKDKKKNDKVFENQPIADAAIMAAISLKWFK